VCGLTNGITKISCLRLQCVDLGEKLSRDIERLGGSDSGHGARGALSGDLLRQGRSFDGQRLGTRMELPHDGIEPLGSGSDLLPHSRAELLVAGVERLEHPRTIHRSLGHGSGFSVSSASARIIDSREAVRDVRGPAGALGGAVLLLHRLHRGVERHHVRHRIGAPQMPDITRALLPPGGKSARVVSPVGNAEAFDPLVDSPNPLRNGRNELFQGLVVQRMGLERRLNAYAHGLAELHGGPRRKHQVASGPPSITFIRFGRARGRARSRRTLHSESLATVVLCVRNAHPER
jgi:hypothetical protein